jgi:hypothetical protein
LTIPNTIQQLGGRFYKAPMKVADQADVSAHVSRMLDETRRDGIAAVRRFSAEYDKWSPSGHGETTRLRLEQNII